MSLRALLALTIALLLLGCSSSESPETADPASPTGEAAAEPAPEPGPAERLGVESGWGPSVETLDQAAELAAGLSPRELAGQVIVAAYDGTGAPVGLVDDLQLGGVIAFSENITSADQIRAANTELRERVRRPWPLFVGIDQEGGIVARATEGVTRFPAFMSAGAGADAEVTRAAMHGLGADLVDLGFSVDFAPVADVTSGPGDPTIGSRSVGSDPALVAEQVAAAVAGFHDAGIAPVIKHFPGHGSAPADSHETLPELTRPRADLDAVDFVPFARGAADGSVPAVMVGHLDTAAIDPGVPSSLSRKVVTGTLREDLGFTGLVVTDAMDMAGVADGRTSAETAVQALRAGVDVLLMPPDPRQARDGILAAVRAGDLSRKRLRQAAARQIALLLDSAESVERRDSGRPDSGRPDSAAASRAFSAAAISVLSGPCQGRLVGEAVRPVGPAETVARFDEAARAAGLQVGSGETVAFTGFGGGPVTADVAVATDTPYVLGRSRAPVRIAAYGDSPGAMAALVDVLLGEAPAPGRSPVEVTGVERAGC